MGIDIEETDMEDRHARHRALDKIDLQNRSANQQSPDEEMAVRLKALEMAARLKALKEADLEDLRMRLYLTALKLLSMKQWRGKYGGQPPAGKEAMDLVQDAFEKFLEGGRTWDHSPKTIFSVLKDFIKTGVSHLARSAENRKTSRATLDPQESGPDTTYISWVAAPEDQNPEAIFDDKDQFRKLLSMYPEGSVEHKVVATIIVEDGEKSREIAKAAELTPNAYNNVKRRVMRKLQGALPYCNIKQKVKRKVKRALGR
jgi:DNA-directed RNA polymerase specialized sigma24 family protein